MGEDQSRKRLGRGLAALIGDIDMPLSGEESKISVTLTSEKQMPIKLVIRNPHNPRRNFPDAEIDDLAQSIRKHGIVQPIVVRPSLVKAEHYELIAGERRWRAAQKADLLQIPVIIRDVDDRTALELAIIENIQRTDLNPVEEASGYQQLIDEYEYTQADLGQIIGKSRSHVANTLRLLKLPVDVQQLLNRGALSAGHARCLITSDNPLVLAERIIKDGLSVRQAETLSNRTLFKIAKKKTPYKKDTNTKVLEKIISDKLGMQVDIKPKPKGGDICIHYKTLDQLDDICQRLQN
ncbi:MAG: ParB family [Candidatus Tokpelaia sp. JSC189]|nr:MAG: ParB family [Candidatus Tokpelaia sp. JSC189]